MFGFFLTFEEPIRHSRSASQTLKPVVNCEQIISSSVPLIVLELKRRFHSENLKILSSLDVVDDSKTTYIDFATLKPLAMHFEPCSGINADVLMDECDRARILVSNGCYVDPILYPNLFLVHDIVKVLPVGSATVERSFSAMNRVMFWTRNSLDSTFISQLMLLSLNKDDLDLYLVLSCLSKQRSRFIKFN